MKGICSSLDEKVIRLSILHYEFIGWWCTSYGTYPLIKENNVIFYVNNFHNVWIHGNLSDPKARKLP
jgi:hypothetical protein